jgi:hypothetical protein
MHRNYAVHAIVLGRAELQRMRLAVLDALMGVRDGEEKEIHAIFGLNL